MIRTSNNCGETVPLSAATGWLAAGLREKMTRYGERKMRRESTKSWNASAQRIIWKVGRPGRGVVLFSCLPTPPLSPSRRKGLWEHKFWIIYWFLLYIPTYRPSRNGMRGCIVKILLEEWKPWWKPSAQKVNKYHRETKTFISYKVDNPISNRNRTLFSFTIYSFRGIASLKKISISRKVDKASSSHFNLHTIGIHRSH